MFCRRLIIFLALLTISTVGSSCYLALTDPSYEFIFPAHFPGIPKESKFYYFINFWMQNAGYFVGYNFVFIDFFIFLTITRHILTEIDIIIEMCKDLGKYDALQRQNDEDIETIYLSGETKIPKSEVLLKLILDRHQKVVQAIKNASDFYSLAALTYETNAFAGFLFIFYLLKTLGEFNIVVVGTSALVPQLFVFSLIGTQILEKGNDMARILYQSQWLALTPKERKMFCTILAMAQKPHTLSAGGFGDVALARFGVVCNIFC